MNLIKCNKYDINLPKMNEAPMPGKFGEFLLNNFSAKAWEGWIAKQTILINENRLNLMLPENREFLLKECKSYLEEKEILPNANAIDVMNIA